jgi:glycosyltransferase involved in cell wall biosynthesis
MFFSIIIPSLNEEKNLPNLLGDLVGQTFNDFEVILVDGSSIDKTIKVATKFKNKIDLKILNSKIRNVSYQRNMGAKKAKSDWIIFMDADNRLPKYFIEGLKYRIHLESPDIFTTWMDVEKENPIEEVVTKTINIGMELIRIAKYPGAMGSMIGINKKGFKKIGGFDANTEFSEDWQFVKDAFSKGLIFKIFKDPKYFYSMRRFRRMGNIKAIQKYAEVNLKTILKIKVTQDKDYPMGGHHD